MYRWTVENEKHARHFGNTRRPSATQTDAEWLAAHAFWINADGTLTKASKRARIALLELIAQG